MSEAQEAGKVKYVTYLTHLRCLASRVVVKFSANASHTLRYRTLRYTKVRYLRHRGCEV